MTQEGCPTGACSGWASRAAETLTLDGPRMDADFLVEYVRGRRTVREYFDLFVRDREFKSALAGCPVEFRDRCIGHLWSAFAELDAIPRTDPFWAGSNMRTTFTRLKDREKAALIDANDVRRCWKSFVVALCSGDLDRFRRAAEALLRAAELDAADFVVTALNLRDVSGWDKDDLAALLQGLPALTRLVEQESRADCSI